MRKKWAKVALDYKNYACMSNNVSSSYYLRQNLQAGGARNFD